MTNLFHLLLFVSFLPLSFALFFLFFIWDEWFNFHTLFIIGNKIINFLLELEIVHQIYSLNKYWTPSMCQTLLAGLCASGMKQKSSFPWSLQSWTLCGVFKAIFIVGLMMARRNFIYLIHRLCFSRCMRLQNDTNLTEKKTSRIKGFFFFN